MTIIWNTEPQGSEGWHQARRGACTGSRFKDARDRLKSGAWGARALAYAYDLARGRVGGTPVHFQGNGYTRIGQEQEPVGRMQYELRTGNLVEEVGFAHTEDHKFGVSVDGLIDDDGIWECKTMVSSKTLFDALVGGDISEYRDQCVGAMWLLHRQWCDLTLWCPDLDLMHIVRINRDEDEIQALVDDLVKFEKFVTEQEMRLRKLLDDLAPVDAPVSASPEPTAQTVKPDEIPESIF